MKTTTGCGALLLALALPLAFPVWAADGASVIKDSEARTKSSGEKARFRMELLDPAGQVQQTREIELYNQRATGTESTLFKFISPPVVQGTGLLIVDTGQAVNDIWMYLPATRRIRRIAGAEKSNWFMGTEFTHEDFEDYKSSAYGFQLDREDEPCGEQQRCYVVSAVAAESAEKQASGYGRKVYWIEKQSMYAVRVDYIDKAGALAKRLDAKKLVRTGRHWRPQIVEMHNLATRRTTRLTSLAREVDVAVDDFHVSQRFLRAE